MSSISPTRDDLRLFVAITPTISDEPSSGTNTTHRLARQRQDAQKRHTSYVETLLSLSQFDHKGRKCVELRGHLVRLGTMAIPR